MKKKYNLIKKKKILHFKKKNIILLLNSIEKKYKTFSFLIKYVYLYYLFHKNIKFKYINNLFFYYLNNKKINKINIIKNNVFINKKTKNKLFITFNNKLNVFKYNYKYFNSNTDIFIYSYIMKNINNKSILKYLYNNFLFINILPYKRIKKAFFYYNKSFIVLNWAFKKHILNFLKIILFLIKYFFFLYIKKFYKNKIILKLYNNIINTLFNNSIITNYLFYSNNIISFYHIYIKKIYYINYIEDIMLISIFQNNSFYYYYLKYYILNFLYLFYFIENTISKYSKTNCYLFINYSLNWKYMLNNAKMWCEYLVYNLKKKNTIRRMFFYIKKQQVREKRSYEFKRLYGHSSEKKLLHIKYPLKGIRILYSGNFKKAKRKKKLHYYIWLSNSKYTGQMPLKKFKYYIDYHYSVAVLRRSSIGIKFWLLFNIF